MKKNYFLRLLYFAILAAVFSSCSYSNYLPVTVYEPLLKEKGERQGVVYPGANHIELQGAYAITNHLAVQAEFWRGINHDNRYSLEILPGYYYHSPRGLCIGVYAGGCFANASGHKDINYSTILSRKSERHINEVRYTSLILQPGIGYRRDIFEVAFATRISYVKFSQYHSEFWRKDLNFDYNYSLSDKFSSDGFYIMLFQPAINFSVGFKNVKAFFGVAANIGANLQSNKDSKYNHPSYQVMLFSCGLKVDLMSPQFFKRKSNKE